MKIKDWKRFQHFKDRRPPWIKLYRDLLEDPDWFALDGEASKVLVMLWLIASEDPDCHGELPDLRKLAFRLRKSETELNQILTKIDHWIDISSIADCQHDTSKTISSRHQDDIKPISGRYQVDTPESEADTESDNIVPTELVDLPSTTRADPIPYKSIIETYNEICVPLGKPAARRNNPKRQARIRQIWNESSRTRTVDWWRGYFAKAMTVPHIAKGFITRDGSLWNGADLDYLLQDKVITKIVEGTYDNAQR
jgi:hypothetical protein